MKHILILVTLAILTFGFSACGDKSNLKTGEIDNLPTKIPTQFVPQVWTPKGVGVISVVDNIPAEALLKIDEGVEGAIRSYRAVQPTWNAVPSDYLVMFIEPQATNMDGSPAVLVNGIQSAGTVIGVGSHARLYSPPVVVVPHQKATNWRHLKYLKFSVWNEFEHRLEAQFNESLFYYYAVINDSHPHTPRVYIEGEEQE